MTVGTVQDVKNAKEQGFSITLPDGNTFDWGKEQGRRVPFGNAKTQGKDTSNANPNMHIHSYCTQGLIAMITESMDA